MKTKILMTALLGSVMLSGCATADDNNNQRASGVAAFKGDPRLGPEVNQICFAGTIDGFEDNRDRTVILNKGVNDKYLVEVFGPCLPLRDAMNIAIDNMGGCLRPGDSLIVSDNIGPGFGMGDPMSVQRCTVNSIYKWNQNAPQPQPDLGAVR